MFRVRSATLTVAMAVAAMVGGMAVAVPAAAATRTETIRIGTSVQGRPLVVIHRWAPGASKRVLVIGNMHGDEQAGLKVIERLRTRPVPANVGLWLIPSINPDGTRANTRTNAHHVDLNRNFPNSWVYSGRGTSKYSGPSAASEPETRALMAFVKRYPPRTTIVFHQPLYGVDSYRAKSMTLVRALARETSLPVKSFACSGTCHGTFTGWHNANVSGSAVTIEFGRTATTWRLDKVTQAVLTVGSTY
jgi:succinylglutamate desuccinylase